MLISILSNIKNAQRTCDNVIEHQKNFLIDLPEWSVKIEFISGMSWRFYEAWKLSSVPMYRNIPQIETSQFINAKSHFESGFNAVCLLHNHCHHHHQYHDAQNGALSRFRVRMRLAVWCLIFWPVPTVSVFFVSLVTQIQFCYASAEFQIWSKRLPCQCP